MLRGYRTYVSALLLFLFGVYGLVTGSLDQSQAIEVILEAAALAGLRAAVS